MKMKIKKIPYRVGQAVMSVLCVVIAFYNIVANTDVTAFMNEEQCEIDRIEFTFFRFLLFYLAMTGGFVFIGELKVEKWTWRDAVVSAVIMFLCVPVGVSLLIALFQVAR